MDRSRLNRPRGSRPSSLYERIYYWVRQIPAGKVATYGQIAKITGHCTARMVGYAMAALPEGSNVPWQRVINHKGEISRRAHGESHIYQRRLLEEEGIIFDSCGRVNLKKISWNGFLHRGASNNQPERIPGSD